MPFDVTLHYDNAPGFGSPHLLVWYTGSASQEDVAPSGTDEFGFVYRVAVRRSTFLFKVKEGPLENLLRQECLRATSDRRRDALIICETRFPPRRRIRRPRAG